MLLKQIMGKSRKNREIAIYFNNYIASVGQKLANSINHTNEHDYKRYLSKILNCSFSFKQINPEDISRIIHNFLPKTSCGHDGLSMKLIKRLKYIISGPLSLIINQSFWIGIFPEKMKIAKIRPVFKKGYHDIVDNYRPISIIPALSKVFEKVAYIQFYDYLVENKLLYPGQYGFRNKSF